MNEAADAAAPQVLQQELFAEDRLVPDDAGYRAPVVAKLVGITYRQLDYWARTGLVEPSLRAAKGSGSQRLYNFRDIVTLKIVKRLLETGVTLQQIRTALDHLRRTGVTDLSQITLMSDGASVYECRSPEDVIDLVHGGQGVFGIAVGAVWREVESDLAQMPAERTDGTTTSADDELSSRRARKIG
jgi:DNA-binding transcriptional MerR regulator